MTGTCPSPTDFNMFVPWAVTQLKLEINVNITTTFEGEYASGSTGVRKRSKAKSKQSTQIMGKVSEHNKTKSVHLLEETSGPKININIIYNSGGDLVHVKIQKNDCLPCEILKIISCTLRFHPHLTRITIDKGLNHVGLFVLSKIIAQSYISEIILDNTMIPKANYYLLLDQKCHLKYLSLARCNLNDAVIKTVASRLPASTLMILNLSSNKITDVGAKYFGEALRSNRKLVYLNLAGNMICDEGAESILNSLMEFSMTADEIQQTKSKCMSYYKEKHNLLQELHREVPKKKPVRTILPTIPTSIETTQALVDLKLGPFIDPFRKENTVIRNGMRYCLGNNILGYLNLAYNNLTYMSVKKLYNVIYSQQNLLRQPIGLINVCIEGNMIPDSCLELTGIDYFIESRLAGYKRSAT